MIDKDLNLFNVLFIVVTFTRCFVSISCMIYLWVRSPWGANVCLRDFSFYFPIKCSSHETYCWGGGSWVMTTTWNVRIKSRSTPSFFYLRFPSWISQLLVLCGISGLKNKDLDTLVNSNNFNSYAIHYLFLIIITFLSW